MVPTTSGGDGGWQAPPTSASLTTAPSTPKAPFTSPEGSLRVVDASGLIQTLWRPTSLGPAPDSLTFAPDGTLYMGAATAGTSVIYKITPVLPGTALGELLLSAEDGSEVYRFDRNGRHLATFDALTSTELRRFEYDDSGRLARVVEEGRRTTQIERNADGVPTAIVSPYGVRTELTLDADGFLERVVDAAGQAVAFEYGNGGLLSAMVDARGGRHEYGYEGNRLVSDRDPSGAVQTLSTSRDGRTSSVTLCSPLGRVTRHDRIADIDGEEQRTTTPGGAVSSSVRDAQGNVTVTGADGTTIATVFAADPRFGAMAALSAETTVTLPSGTANVITQAASAELANGADPFSGVRLQSQTQINGRIFTSEYDAVTRSWEEAFKAISRTNDKLNRTTGVGR
jgi:YD repeat-containing protein